MKFDPAKHHCRSLRLRHYDYYAQPGVYFATNVAQDRACLFGDIIDREMSLNDAGRMVETVYRRAMIFQ
jgi:putative transposase